MLVAAIPAFGGCFQYKIGAVHEPDHPLADRVVFSLAFTFVVGLLCPLVPACLLALVCTRQPGLSRLLGRLLSMKMLSGLADVSYEVYLLHPLVSPNSAKCDCSLNLPLEVSLCVCTLRCSVAMVGSCRMCRSLCCLCQ